MEEVGWKRPGLNRVVEIGDPVVAYKADPEIRTKAQVNLVINISFG
jgi:hypothetical protein